MTDIVIVAVLILVLALALLRGRKHFKGGGCCGSKGGTIRDKKMLTAPKLGEKTLVIDGMSCENCEICVENALNRLDNVAAKVSHKKKTAVVSYSAEVSDELLKETVEKLGYSVVEIR